MNHLADNLASPVTTPQRQMTLDTHIRSRIQAELGILREQEAQVRREIEQALEKENLDRDIRMSGISENTAGEVKNSAALLGDMEEIRQKVDRFQSRQQLSQHPAVKVNGEAVVSCYKCVPGAVQCSTSSDCENSEPMLGLL